MFGPFTSSRLALILRRLRGRFGISAPRVAVRTHLPWYWRALSVILLSGASLALAGWIYDAGRQFAGFHQGASEQEIEAMRDRVAKLEAELKVLARSRTPARVDCASRVLRRNVWPSRSVRWRKKIHASRRIWPPSKAWLGVRRAIRGWRSVACRYCPAAAVNIATACCWPRLERKKTRNSMA